MRSLLIALAMTAGIGTAAGATADSSMTVNLSGEASNGAILSARFTPSDVSAGRPVVTGTLTGTLVDATGVGHPLDQQVTLPVHQAGSSDCPARELMLGPANLDLLGTPMHVGPSQLPVSSGRCPTAP
jgi:hypothetical protein